MPLLRTGDPPATTSHPLPFFCTWQVTGHAIAQPYTPQQQQPMQRMPMQPVMAQPYMPPGQQQYGQQYGQQYPQQPVVMAQPYVPGQPVMAQAYTPPGK